jgi:hypothetical protein
MKIASNSVHLVLRCTHFHGLCCSRWYMKYSVVNIASQKTQNNLIFILHFSPPSPFQGEGKGEGHNNPEPCEPDTGSVNENVLPQPSFDSTQIFPPCNSTSALEIARPRPVPLGFIPPLSGT